LEEQLFSFLLCDSKKRFEKTQQSAGKPTNLLAAKEINTAAKKRLMCLAVVGWLCTGRPLNHTRSTNKCLRARAGRPNLKYKKTQRM
jgi:hypothetical protein